MTVLEVADSQQEIRKREMQAYRGSAKEQERIRNLFGLMPSHGADALDIGARDGFLSLRLTERFSSVTALDLEKPEIEHPSVRCFQGDVTAIDLPENGFDLVLCAEVLEHIPPALLSKACAEMARVSRKHVLIGVPYNQDTRLWRTTCRNCGGKGPPWGHVNSFDEKRLQALFPKMRIEKIEFVGTVREKTNALSAFLMDLAGNPFGTYDQEEGCVHCGGALAPPINRTLPQRLCSFTALKLMQAQSRFGKPRPNWIHILFSKSRT